MWYYLQKSVHESSYKCSAYSCTAAEGVQGACVQQAVLEGTAKCRLQVHVDSSCFHNPPNLDLHCQYPLPLRRCGPTQSARLDRQDPDLSISEFYFNLNLLVPSHSCNLSMH